MPCATCCHGRPALLEVNSAKAYVFMACAARSGGMIFTFYKAQGLAVGSSLVEEDKLDLAKELEAKAKEKVHTLSRARV